jgi:hypothetical protein
MLRWALLPVFSLISLGLSAFVVRDGIRSSLLLSTPGLIFFVLSIIHRVMDLRMRRARRTLQET